MPPRKQAAIAADPFRRDLMREFGISQNLLDQLLGLDLAEALWRIGHEHTTHVAWSQRRRDFLMQEIRKAAKATKRNGNVVASANLEPEFIHPRSTAPKGAKVT